MAVAVAGRAEGGLAKSHVLIVGACSAGTVFEWYDFYLYGSLASVITKQFFSGVNETTGYILALLAFASGFVVRPFGAAVFGRLGDLWGRKNTFLVTMLLMGLSTFVVGLLPSYRQVGLIAPVGLVALRLLQGLAIGGEYGGAAVYVAEHAPSSQRGLYGSWIQTTASLGVILSLLVILASRRSLGEDAFQAWGWRVPFLVSAALLALSMWIRLKLDESPVFAAMAAEGRSARKPLKEAFEAPGNVRRMLTALFSIHAGQGAVWYTSQFYALFFLERMLKVDGALANSLVVISLVIGTPAFVLFGWLSDKVGRKPVMMLGFLLAIATIFPLYKVLTTAANPALAAAAARSPVVVIADPKACSLQFDPIGKAVFDSSCDIAKSALASAGVPYRTEAAAPGAIAVVRIGGETVQSFEGHALPREDLPALQTAWRTRLGAALAKAGYPQAADSAGVNRPLVLAVLVALMLSVTLICGPIPAAVVEMYPARIRYTSMSLPFHLGNGWFGGFMPTVAFAMVAATGNIYFGLWYPVVIAALCLIVGMLFLPESRTADIRA